MWLLILKALMLLNTHPFPCLRVGQSKGKKSPWRKKGKVMATRLYSRARTQGRAQYVTSPKGWI